MKPVPVAPVPVAPVPVAPAGRDEPKDEPATKDEPAPEPEADEEAEPAAETEADEKAPATADAGEAPEVEAVTCPDGHANPPGTDSCRVCGREVTDTTVTTVARPSLGRLRVSTGGVVELTKPVVVGRRPPEDATVEGEEATVVTIAESDAISRTHAEVRLVGWEVQVVDKGSANHTYVTLPDADPLQLRPDEPFTIPPGTVVSLAGAAELTYEVGED